jgi:hypothetical protein
MRLLITLVLALLLFTAGLNAQYYVAPTGSDSDPGTLAAPFQSIYKAQHAMRNSAVKVTYVRAGFYKPKSSTKADGDGCEYGGQGVIDLQPADSGETYQYYPADGPNTAIFDGGAPAVPVSDQIQGDQVIHSQPGIWCFVASNKNVTNVTFNGLQIQNFEVGAFWLQNGSSYTLINNDIHDMQIAAFGADAIALNCTHDSLIAHNSIHHVAYMAVQLGGNDCPGGLNNDVIDSNSLIDTCFWAPTPGGDQDGGDCGAIYGQALRVGIVVPGSIKVTNNYIRDVNKISNGGGDWGNCCDTGIYMDVLSGVLVSGNVVTGSHSSCFNLHGGNDEILNNVCDIGNGAMNIVAYTVADTRNNLNTAGNSFHNNIVIAAISGGGNGFRADNDGGTAVAMNIHDNLYFNYVGASVNSSGNPRQGQPGDSNPVYANPMISGWLVGMLPISPAMAFPIAFPCLPGGWGPPGFVLPQDSGSLPGWPLMDIETGCGEGGYIPIGNYSIFVL